MATATARAADGARGAAPLDLGRAIDIHPSVGLRPERGGALAYHYGTRALHFVNDARLAAALHGLSAHASAGAALTAARVPAELRGAYAVALGRLAAAGVLIERGTS